LPPLPLAPVPPSAAQVNVAPSSTVNLLPGIYGDVSVGVGGTLILKTGTYNFGNVAVLGGGTVTTSGSAVNIFAMSVVTGTSATFVPQANLSAKDLNVAVAGSVHIGAAGSITALVEAPHGDIVFEANVTATGAFAAFNIATADHVTVTFQDGLAAPAHGTQQLKGYYGNQQDGSYAMLFPVERDRQFTISFGLPVPNSLALTNFIHDVSDPTSPNYRQYLTPTQFKGLFGASDPDYAELKRWAVSQGLTIGYTYTNNLLLTVTGTAAQIERALYVNLVYRAGGGYPPGFVAVDREPSLDFGPTILWITGFNDYQVSRAMAGCSQPVPCSANNPAVAGSGTKGGLSASDLRQAYLGSGPAAASCLSLTGAGQTVGILSLEATSLSDRLGYIANEPAPGGINFTGSVSIQTLGVGGLAGLHSADGEAALDMEAVMAMAPGANIKIFQGPTGVTLHADDLLHSMATDGTLTVATCSYEFGRSDNSTQALAELAAQGVSFFDASGDWGDEGDPQGSRNMDYKTLVGGTTLAVTGFTTRIGPTGLPTTVYLAPYYTSEVEWNGSCPGIDELVCTDPPGVTGGYAPAKDITGGGVMNGYSYGGCQCFPEPFCCGAGVPLPGYQQGVPMVPVALGGNGGSTQWRNYPDVSANANPTFSMFWNSPSLNGGTSLAAPTWAGFTALVNQQAAKNGVGQLGFANQVLYAIGKTRGSPGLADLYRLDFNDINDGVFNQDPQPNLLGLGYPSVNGYDLATGWGSPTCNLLQLLGSFNPLSPQLYNQIVVHVASGHDGVNDQSSVTLDVLSIGGGVQHFPLKAQGETGWDAFGTVHEPGSFGLNPPLRPQDIVSTTLTLHENGQGGINGDNWDVGGLQILLANVHVPYACITDLSGNGLCDANQVSCSNGQLSDSHTGVVRLSETSGSSGQGPIATFAHDLAHSGCADWNGAAPSEPYDQLEFVLDTGDDDLRSDSGLVAYVLDSSNKVVDTVILHQSGETLFDNDTEWDEIKVPVTAVRYTDIASIKLEFVPGPSDEWHMQSVQVYGRNSAAGGQLVCLFNGLGNPEKVFKGGDGNLTLAKGSGCQ